MKFIRSGHMVQLTGDPDPQPNTISIHQVRKLVSSDQVLSLFCLNLSTDPPPLATFSEVSPDIHALIHQHGEVFRKPTSLPPVRATDHAIPVMPNASPVKGRPFKYPFFQKQEIERQVAKMLQTGEIQPSNNAFSSPVLLVKKKDGSWRFCVDYRALNAITVCDNYPIPTIDELLDELGHAQWFSKLDLLSGYHQIRMRPEDIHKTAFRTHDGHYEFRVMPFGLSNAPATFQATMNNLLRPYLRRFVIVFFDDILIYSPSLEVHLTHLTTIFQLLSSAQFYLRPDKCCFGLQQVEYLGHIVAAGTVSPDPAKVSAMREWPQPLKVKALKGFLGLTGFYRKFIKGYALIAEPLTSLLKKDSFEWNTAAA
jgi:hypothetical protein